MEVDSITLFLMGLILILTGFCFGMLISNLNLEGKYILLSQETANDICINLTGNESAIGEDNLDKKLICKIPSFDSTQNIIIKSNNGGE